MTTYLAILNSTVVEIVNIEGDFDAEAFSQDYDTITVDVTGTYNLGDTYELEDYLIRNNLNVDSVIGQTPTKTTALWSKANSFEREYIAGSMYTIIAVLLINNSIIGKAVSDWSRSIWDLYYQEKSFLESDNSYISYEDFRGCGDCPYTVPEMIAEFDLVQA